MVDKWSGEIMADAVPDPMSPGAYWRNLAAQRELEASRVVAEADRTILVAVRMQRACIGMARWAALAYSVAFGLGLLAGVLGMAWAVGLIR